jgi:transketolase
MQFKDYTKNFRRVFADEIYKRMLTNENIWVVTSDLGYGFWDQVKRDFPNRFLNVGAAEQSLVGIGVGLALQGRIPIVYSITSFLLFRPFETIRNYIHREGIPVKLVGSGRDRDYEIDGYSHWSEEDKEIMKIFKNIKSRWPKDYTEIPALVDEMVSDQSPWYMSLKK